MGNDTDRVIESLRQIATEIEEDTARIRDYELSYVWHDDELEGKHIDIWIEY